MRTGQKPVRQIYLLACKCFIRNVCNHAGIRVRFAPSPTGLLHLGGLRTAIYNYLFAKSMNGSFILRIEDTDQTRLIESAVERLEEDLNWAGLHPDEGPSAGGPYGPYFQSQRLALYKQEVGTLLANGKAYYCFCSNRRLDLLRKDSLRRREVPKYDNHCRHLNDQEVRSKLQEGLTYCVRFKLTSLAEPYEDLIFGEITHNVAEFEGDPVILKSDGYPTYHLANVVDDHYMKISHVLRGVEWQPSTAKHLLLYKAFQWNPPKYAHLPLLMNEDGSKLSKRNNNLTVDALRRNGIYPRALVNFLTLCGGGFRKVQNTEKLTYLNNLDELIPKFSLDLLNVNNCQIPLERLKEFNRVEFKLRLDNEKSLNELVKTTRAVIEEEFSQRNIPLSPISDERLKNVLKWSHSRISTIKDLISPEFSFLWIEPSEEFISKCNRTFFETLPELIDEIEECKDFDGSKFSEKLKEISARRKLKYSEFMKSLRICLMGSKQGPSISEIFTQLGKEMTLNRLRRTQFLSKRASQKKQVGQ